MASKVSFNKASWVALLRKDVLLSEVDEQTASALLGHLADLGVWEVTGRDNWQFVPDSNPVGSSISDEVKENLRNLCDTEDGYALKYFLQDPLGDAKSVGSLNSDLPEAKAASEKNRDLLDRKTSNLSNLQIVNKYGRQMESFMELEKSFTEKLVGPHTTLKDARRIFNFVLGKMKQKEPPRAWEQLSRRRHK